MEAHGLEIYAAVRTGLGATGDRLLSPREEQGPIAALPTNLVKLDGLEIVLNDPKPHS